MKGMNKLAILIALMIMSVCALHANIFGDIGDIIGGRWTADLIEGTYFLNGVPQAGAGVRAEFRNRNGEKRWSNFATVMPDGTFSITFNRNNFPAGIWTYVRVVDVANGISSPWEPYRGARVTVVHFGAFPVRPLPPGGDN